jgi:hypothetical protein
MIGRRKFMMDDHKRLAHDLAHRGTSGIRRRCCGWDIFSPVQRARNADALPLPA